uniref:Serine/threonine-protein phosphatase 1 regulatory subunit 10 n=1 Tax=Schistocephalus solidus TaxID=70667 RepID=A0A0X3NV58_SCHSO
MNVQDQSNFITDPDQLLIAFKDNLTENGGIRKNAIPALINLMSDTNGKLVPKCVSLCIISASDNASQAQLCQSGAWDILLKWLQEALKEDHQSFLIELLNVYLNLPVRFENLTQNVCPKLINSLAKRSENKAVKSAAGEIVKKWKEVISRETRREGNVEPPVKKKRPESDGKVDVTETEQNATAKDSKKRRSTVKMPPTVMRTAGIEDSVEQFTPKSRSEVLSKKSKHDSTEKSTPSLPIESFHQKITVVPTEPKKPSYGLHESSNFINSLTTTTQPVVRKKRKIPKPEVPVTSEVNSVSDDQNQVRVKSEAPTEEEMDTSASATSDTEPLKKSSLANFTNFILEKKTKKRVTWAPEDKLQAVSFFEVDENERVNVNRISLAEIRQKELSLERQLFRRHEEIEIKDAKWQTPVPLELTIIVEPGCKSVERQLQRERERYVLQAIYFTRESIPPSPEEPEKEEFESASAVEIPLEDLHAKEHPSEREDLLIIKDQGDGKAKVSLNPEVADLVQSLVYSFNPTCEAPTPLTQLPPTTTSASEARSLPTLPETLAPNNDMPKPVYSGAPMISGDDAQMEVRVNKSVSPSDNHPVSEMSPSPSFMPDRVPVMPGRPRGPPPHRPPPTDVRGPLFPPHRPPFPPERGPMPRLPPPPPPNFVGRPPFRGHPPHMFGGGRPPVGGPRGGGLRRGGGGHRGEQVCKFFQQGTCRNGANCSFLHPGFPSKPGW